jgi:hypothetical protein
MNPRASNPDFKPTEPMPESFESEPAMRKPALRQRLRAPLQHLVRQLSERSFGPYAIASAPVVATTVLAPAWMSWFIGVLSLTALYRVARQLDATLFAMAPTRGFLVCALPLNGLMLLWCVAMAAADKSTAIASIVFPYLSLLALCLAPACRWSPERAQRRVPLRVSFGIGSVLALLCHGASALHELGLL